MIEFVEPIAEWIAALIEILGIFIIVAFSVYTLAYGAFSLLKKKNPEIIYSQIRRRLGRGILLGLEFLVAADIIHTVAVELTFTTVGVLAIVVLIRTFLSFTLDLEITGRWPWQDAPKA
ncbi:DUF1622 domain-containing protein [Gilvimarinus agarilyticus]|uniref:DUF1622 domain-containing protein n=1 Tax=Gilvimarinus agarilyticus TaxID=679259 RepID=UPI0006966BAB|nr:DUF1622 domain-containing protein [Gilvimarinus agarilyticus]